MSKKCNICNAKIGFMNSYKISNGTICCFCTTLSPSFRTETIENMKNFYNINNDRKLIFQETQKLKNLGSETIHIDSKHHLFYIGKPKKNTNYIIYAFDELVTYGSDTLETKIATTKKGGITRAIIGNAVAGPVGAIVGATTAKTESKVTNEKKIFYIQLKTYSGNKKISIFNPPIGLVEFLDKCINEK